MGKSKSDDQKAIEMIDLKRGISEAFDNVNRMEKSSECSKINRDRKLSLDDAGDLFSQKELFFETMLEGMVRWLKWIY